MLDLTRIFLDVPLWLWMIGFLAIILLAVVIAKKLDFEGVNITATPPFFVFRFKRKFAPTAPPQDRNRSDAHPSVDISGNKAFGDTRIGVKRGDVRLDENVFAGKTDIQVEDDQKKPRR